MNKNISLKEAVEFCENLGLVVFDKEKLKTLSYHVAIPKNPDRLLSLTEEEILGIHERKVEKSLINQLLESGAIQKFVDDQEMVRYHRWNLKVVV